MKTAIGCVAYFVLVVFLLDAQWSSAFAQGTAFMYQGQLNDGNGLAKGSYDLTFTLYDSTNLPGTIISGPLTNSAVSVSNGLFSVTLDFGPGVFNGNNYWLGIGVQSNGGSGFTTLAPRQPILPVPYAIMANSASNLLGRLPTAQLFGTIPAGQISGTVSLAQLPGAVVTNGATGVNISGTFSGNGSGLTNVPASWQVVSASNQTAVAGQSYLLTNNSPDTVTLPASPNIGDIVTVVGMGSNGWQVTPNANQAFTGTQSDAPIAYWQSIASSSDGGRLVAAVSPPQGGGGIYTSSNFGTNWIEQSDAPTNVSWASVASSSDGSHLLAAINLGGIYTSTDFGTDWTQQSGAPMNVHWGPVASSSDGSHLVAAIYDGGLYTSSNYGTNWTQQLGAPMGSDSPLTNWASIASSSDGSRLVGVLYKGGIYTSSNFGTNWIEQSNAPMNAFWVSVASSSDGSHLTAVEPGYGGIYISSDFGSNWTARSIGSNYVADISVASSSDGSHLVIAVYDGGIYTSSDFGSNWTEQLAAPTNAYWGPIASSSDGSRFVAGVSYGGGIYTYSTVTFSGTAGEIAQFQYIGGGQWQLLTIPVTQVVGAVSNGATGVNLSGSFTGNGSGLTNVPGTVVWQNVAGTNQQAQPSAAYVATNASLTTITLPFNPSIGSVVQVSGSGAGGWQAVTAPGATWTQAAAPSEAWASVASSSDGTHLVAVVNDASSFDGAGIYTSTNGGESWTQTSAPPETWQSVASSSDGIRLVAVVNAANGGIYTSTNSGGSWTQSSAPLEYWGSVASSSDGTRLVAGVGRQDGAPGGIYTSTNSGTNWTQSSAPSGDWVSIASSSDGTYLVAVNYGGGIYTSTNNGGSWTQTSAPGEGWASVSSSSDATHLVAAVDGGGIYTSTDSGGSWTQTSAPSESWRSVASSSDGVRLVAVVWFGGIFSSTDSGGTWVQTTAPSDPWESVASSSDGTRLSAVVFTGGIYVSTPSITQGTAGETAQFQYMGNGQWRALTNLTTPTIANYIDSYSTNTNAVVTANTFQNITNQVNAQISGWTHASNTTSFTCGQNGLYLVHYTAEATTTASTATTVSLHAIDNGTEIPDSQATGVANTANQTVPISKSFIASFNSGDVLQFQFAGSSTSDRLVSNFGLGTTRPSFSCTIVRIQ